MSIVDGILNQTLSSIYSTSRDGYGRITTTELYTDIPCRFQRKFTLILDKAGHEAVSAAQVWINDTLNGDDISIDIDYICTYSSVNYTVMSYEYLYNLAGEVEYIKLYLK